MKVKLTTEEAEAVYTAIRKRLDDIGPAHPSNDTLHDAKAAFEDALARSRRKPAPSGPAVIPFPGHH